MAAKKSRPAEDLHPPPKKQKTQAPKTSRRSARVASRSHLAGEHSTIDPPFTRGTEKALNTAKEGKVKRAAQLPKLPKAVEPLNVPATAASQDGQKRMEQGQERGNYWLMKAEPTSRLEKGVDIKFSIDDLAAKKTPEPWDGIRNHVAKNNILAMRKGDLAFFYHSSCKVPGIVGTMEIVSDEASPDELAFDPTSPYYDEKSDRAKPRWFCPLVEFRTKFKDIVTLERLKEEKAPGKPLQNMQLLKLSRLSVSKVEKSEWDFIMDLVQKQEEAP